jgi:hypothetical protein
MQEGGFLKCLSIEDVHLTSASGGLTPNTLLVPTQRMLPLPASSASFRNAGRLGGGFQAFSRDAFRLQFFLARSRITNLGVAILVSLLLISASANLKYAMHGSSVVEREHDFAEFIEERYQSKERHPLEVALSQAVPSSIEDTISEVSQLRGGTHLVIVAGHAIWAVCRTSGEVIILILP